MNTPTPSIADMQHWLEAEQHAERRALAMLRGVTFTDCLKLNHLSPTREVLTPKGDKLMLRGSDIYQRETWHKFLAQSQQASPVTQLTVVGEGLAQQYQAWLLSAHTARYQALSTREDLAWLERVVLLAVTRRIMEEKYEQYSTQGQETFADPRVASEMGRLLLLHHLVREAARLVHHIVKDPEQAQALIAQFYQEHERQMQARALLTGGALPVPPSAATPDSSAEPGAYETPQEEEPHA